MGKPVVLSVDDDPAVSRAVARDLRRRYGEDYCVLCASSAAEGLDALRELKLRGDPVAVLLADYRMPQMNGIEFLEHAVEQVRIVGHRWSALSFHARDLLARNAVLYAWYSADEPEGERLLAAAGA